MPRPSVQVDTSGLNDILRRLDDNRDAIVRRVAFEVEAEAKQFAPVDTGALKASIHTSMTDGVAHVGPSVEYGIYQELGTSVNAAQPYLVPAADIVRTRLHQFMDDLQNLAEGGRVGD